jgi:hypothetical protein
MDFREFVTGQRRPSTRRKLLQYWQTLRPDTPLLVNPINADHQGSTKAEDGIRLTGSPQFIAATIARLKELLAYENEQTKIEIVYQQSATQMEDGKQSYVMYIQVKQKPPHKVRPHKIEPIKPV